jgi:hypothetical protein
MSTANITNPPLGSTLSSATRGGPETTAAGDGVSVGETERNLGQPLRTALCIVRAEWWAARHGRTTPLVSVGDGAPR